MRTKGYCNMHYKRIRNYGSLEDPTPTLAERFWPKVQKTGSCWLWIGCKNNKGYGTTRVDGKTVYAHRASYEMAHGPIPAGMLIDHKCHTPACVNPAHLRPATDKQNMENLNGPKVTSKSGVRGVYMRDYGRWQVQVTHNRRVHNGGTYIELADAEQAAIELRNKLFTHNHVDRITS